MSDAQEKDTVMQHFDSGRLPRLELPMLPRDPNRALGTARSALCSSFNYVRRYPKKLELFVDVLKYVTNFAMAYQHYDKKRRDEAKVVEKVVKEVVEEQTSEVSNVK